MKNRREILQKDETLYRNIFDSVTDGLIILDRESGRIVDANSAISDMHGYSTSELIGLQVSAILHEDSFTEFMDIVRIHQPDTRFDTLLRHICRDGSIIFGEWHVREFVYQGRTCLLSVVRDITKRIWAEQYLNQRVESRTHEQAILLKISHTLAFTLEFQPDLILDQLREIVKFSHGGIFALENLTLVALAIRGLQQQEQTHLLRIQLQSPEIKTDLFNEHRPIRIANVWGNDPPAINLRSLFEDDASGLLKDIQSWMWVPLAVKGNLIGIIGVGEIEKNFYTAHHASLALSVANQAAITMVNTELNRQAQELAVLEERQRLARNLHDGVNQSLFSAGLIAEVLPRLWERDKAEALKSLADLRRLTRGAQAEMRAMLAELRPSTITDSNLGELLLLLGNALSGRTNIPFSMEVVGEFSLPADVQIAFYRICQEALNNVARHSKAKHVEIYLLQEGEKIELRIHDNGKGFDTQRTISGHYGLEMMRERAESVGASLTVVSQPGSGTKLTLLWTNPLLQEVS